MSDPKSRNARAVHAFFLFIIISTISLPSSTLHAHYLKHLSTISRMLTFCLNHIYHNYDRQTKTKLFYSISGINISFNQGGGGGGVGRRREGVGHQFFEPLVGGGSFNFQLPMGMGHPIL